MTFIKDTQTRWKLKKACIIALQVMSVIIVVAPAITVCTFPADIVAWCAPRLDKIGTVCLGLFFICFVGVIAMSWERGHDNCKKYLKTYPEAWGEWEAPESVIQFVGGISIVVLLGALFLWGAYVLTIPSDYYNSIYHE